MSDIASIVKDPGTFDYSKTFDIYQTCARQIAEGTDEANESLIRILDNRAKFDSRLDNMLADLIEAVGFYPYLAHEKLQLSSTSGLIRMGRNHSNNLAGKIFHDEQREIAEAVFAKENIVVSAPTSFGKSLLIEEVVASKMFSNIVIIQPTLALLDETRRKLGKYQPHYKLILRTSQEAQTSKGTIFLLTAERVNEYRDFPTIDFVIVDEFYKLSARRDDERSDSLNNAILYLLRRFSPQFYFAGPNVDSVSERFLGKYNARFFTTKSGLVATDVIDVHEQHNGQFGDRGAKKSHKERTLFELLDDLKDEQTLIYCASPNRARSLARLYLEHLVQKNIKPFESETPLSEWITANVSPLWSLIPLLKYGIAFHDGALQRHITTTIIDYFGTRQIRALFCTATIIEGVNTNAKNVIYFDQRKGKETLIDSFDYANIRGRAGRMMEHYVGRVYNFCKPPPRDKIDIDIPFVDQAPVADEVLINLSHEDVLNPMSDQYHYITGLSPTEREIFSQNAIYVRGQQNLLARLREVIRQDASFICWEGTPKYEQLSYTLSLAWDTLLKPDEDVKPMTKARLSKITFDYGMNKSINALVQNIFKYQRLQEKNSKKSDANLMDEAIRDAFQIMRYWFQYKIPKWLVVLDRLQRFVCGEHGLRSGSYVYYAALLENDFIRDNLSILAEFGVPRSAIEKIGRHISPDLSQDEVLSFIKRRRLATMSELTKYEKQKINTALE
jgi:hypothetical protein